MDAEQKDCFQEMIQKPASGKYDYIFIGTGMIPVLEAVYLSHCGKSVLMIDNQGAMGGAWLPIEIFGLTGVENAIHYFLPDPYAFEFMRDLLGWRVIPSPRKFRLIPLLKNRYLKLPYDNILGKIIGHTITAATEGNFLKTISTLFHEIRLALTENRQPSYYVEGGTVEMLDRLDEFLSNSDVEVKYLNQINEINIDNKSNTVKVITDKDNYLGECIYITHGSRIPLLTCESGKVEIVEKNHLRPAVHMLVCDNTPSNIFECIFTADPLIKYIHDITRFTNESDQLAGRKKLFVFALHKDVEKSDDVYVKLMEKICNAGMISKDAVLENRCWWDVYLPRLYDEDLHMLRERFFPQVEILKTENTSRSIGYHSSRWASKLKPLLSELN